MRQGGGRLPSPLLISEATMNPVTYQSLGQHCLGAFKHFVPASLAAFYRIDANLQGCDFQLRGMQPPMHDAYLNHFRDLDPLSPGACAASGLPVMSLQQGLRRQPAASNQLYQGFLHRYAVVDVVEVIAHVDARPVAGISLLRHADLGPFSAHELNGLLPLHGLMQMAAQSLPSEHDRLQQLTPRERQIALLLRDGASNKELARELDLGLPTVKTHLLNLFRKQGVSNRTELVAALFI